MPSDQRPFVRVAIWLSAICLFCAGSATAQNGPSGEPSRVVAVRVVTESGSVLEQNPPQLTLQPGQPFSMEAESASLRELYRTGRYADLRAELTDMPGGVRLDFVVRQNFYINRVQIAGLREPPGESLALSALRLNLGEIFRESDMKEALERLRQTLEDDGQYQAKIDYETTPHPDTLQMDILVRVTPGPRARIGAITIQNQTEFPDEELRGRLKLKAGREITSDRLNRAARPRAKMAGEKELSRRARHSAPRRLRRNDEYCAAGGHVLRGIGSSPDSGRRKGFRAHAAQIGAHLPGRCGRRGPAAGGPPGIARMVPTRRLF